jgi:hypothetical protein
MSARYTAGRYKAWDDNGNPLPTARLYTYVNGTTTHQNAFTSATLATPCTYTSDGAGGLYIAMDARGEANVWLGPTLYTLTLKTSLGATIFSDSDQGQDSAATTVYTPAGTGAVATTVQAKLQESVSLADRGVIANGSTDDYTSVSLAISSLPATGGTILVRGTPLLGSTLVVNKKVKFVFDGARGTVPGTDLPTSYFIKKSTVVGNGISVTASGVVFEGGGLVCQAGNTGDGISLLGNAPTLRDVTVIGAGNDNIRIGNDAASGFNVNAFLLDNCQSLSAGRRGIYQYSGQNDGNAGTVRNCVVRLCAEEGIRDDNGLQNTYEGNLPEGNTGYGIHFLRGRDNILKGGDYEANTAGQILIDDTVQGLTLIGIDQTTPVTNNAPQGEVLRLDRYVAHGMENEFLVTGTGTTSKTITSVTKSNTTLTFIVAGHSFIAGDRFAVILANSVTDPKYDGGYVVAGVTDANTFTVTVSADRASKLPASMGAIGAQCIVGYQATSTGWWHRHNDLVTFGGQIINSNVAPNALMSGLATIRGFPFYDRIAATTFAIHCQDGVTFPAGSLGCFGELTVGAQSATIRFPRSAAAAQTANIGAGGVSQTANIQFTGSYRIVT